MKLNVPKIVIEFLMQRLEHKFTAREIAEWIVDNFPDECRQKQREAKGNRLDSKPALITQIAAEISSYRPKIQKQQPEVKTTEGRPRKFYFSKSTDQAEINQAESLKVIPKLKERTFVIKERDLYPMLIEFLWTEQEIYSMRIDEKRAKNKRGAGGNKWLYPDIVGIEDLSSDWHRETKDCVQEYAANKSKLWSFETKILINRSNIREAFFQAVSNSSWANFGYLVASEIEGTDTLKELRMLSSLHGIGFIRLDSDNPSESEIIIPAKERNEIDWDTANRLVEENKDFMEYIKSIRQFYQTGEIPLTNFKDLHSLIENQSDSLK